MYDRFGLILNVNHACNLRCSYCYTGKKFNRPMPLSIAAKAIDRAVQSIRRGGTLELGFFGGEPLLEARLIQRIIARARATCPGRAIALRMTMTTNGTITDDDALSVMGEADLDLTISCDGLRHVHDRHRTTIDGAATSRAVERTMRRLIAGGRFFRVNAVVRPDTAGDLAAGVAYLRAIGVTHIDLSLDLWTRWTAADRHALCAAIERLGDLWLDGLPRCGINWFDEQALKLSRVPHDASARCGFGAGEIAIAPSGRLYPCERLMGEDTATNPMRLAGHVNDGCDFLDVSAQPQRDDPACDGCAIESTCSTTCRCSNYVRTGDVTQPDRLLCLLNETCARIVAAHLWRPIELTIHTQPEYA